MEKTLWNSINKKYKMNLNNRKMKNHPPSSVKEVTKPNLAPLCTFGNTLSVYICLPILISASGGLMLEYFWDSLSPHVISQRLVRTNEKLFSPINLVKESPSES